MSGVSNLCPKIHWFTMVSFCKVWRVPNVDRLCYAGAHSNSRPCKQQSKLNWTRASKCWHQFLQCFVEWDISFSTCNDSCLFNMAQAKSPVQRMVLATHAKEGSSGCQPQGWPNETRRYSSDAWYWYLVPMMEFMVQLWCWHTSLYHITDVPVTCGKKGIPVPVNNRESEAKILASQTSIKHQWNINQTW